MSPIKREPSSSPSPSPSSSAERKPTTPTPTPKSAKRPKPSPQAPTPPGSATPTPVSKGKGRSGPKARIPPCAKVIIAEEIILAGLAHLDIAALALKSGLSEQQVRSQICDNRQNVRKQLGELVKALQ